MSLSRRFASFASVGAVGFAVDALLFLALTSHAHWPIHWARAVSATCSITTTWLLNRQVTFADRRSSDRRSEYFRYVFVQVVGLGVNLGTFALALWAVPALRARPVIALALGAGVALAFNFASAHSVAFRPAPRR
jgi:putative flippase GtrA